LPHGTAIINADDPSAHCWDEMLMGKHTLRFSTKSPEAVYARDIVLEGFRGSKFTLVTPEGQASIILAVPGLHNVSNALAAACAVHAIGVPLLDIATRLSSFTGVSGRLAFRIGKYQSHIIDDTYNANLRSVITALDVLAMQPGHRILVLGDLGELGAHSQAHHEEIGMAAKARDINCVMTCGQHSIATARAFGPSAKHYESQEALLPDLLNMLNEQTTVLVKGSRSSGMERIVHQLTLEH
jgi:UDP-N-acetylmuramoyl-tripeptide--D-alanyl-D-alanine ligase